jgi:choline transport protein
MPLNAALLEGVVVSVGARTISLSRPLLIWDHQLYGLIFLGSSSAFSSMAGACIVFMTTSYVIPQGIAAWRGRQKVLPERTFDLGRYGYPLNVLSCVWVLFIDVIYCFPTVMPVTKTNMNWIRYVLSHPFSSFSCWHVTVLTRWAWIV